MSGQTGLAGVRDGFQVHADGFTGRKRRQGPSRKPPPPGEVTVSRRCAPQLWEAAVALANGDRSRITVHSWSDVSVAVVLLDTSDDDD